MNISANYFEKTNPYFMNKNFSLSSRVDPDSLCKDLYVDLADIYCKDKKLPNGNIIKTKEIVLRLGDKGRYYELVVRIYDESKWIATVGLGSDYLGPSIYWAIKAGVSIENIKSFLKVTRSIGGHILWPRWIKVGNNDFVRTSINNAKGGAKGFYDRIDLTLCDLKKWYEGKQQCKLESVFDENEFWFQLFKNFECFIKYFHLESFTNEGKFSIRDLTSFSKGRFFALSTSETLIPSDIDGYNKYIDGSVEAITERSGLIKKNPHEQIELL
jgi:hypothetical protein